ncbi:TerB family tellurite resistance protein [Zavarzinia compransoris]|uniref:tellurite resistance TerB family protein n=1 Tax=Zavarzinia marina TaxID=2911065 RepID=UPI001F3AC07C|nr:TerB family tellurite resistance protein [Zavarzinia marina]MCF4164213.1 TerB family tellurite resistance protein [Zavarzinia marina]
MDLPFAAAVLLLEAAAQDDSVDDAELDTIQAILVRRFDLDPEGARTLLATAGKRQAESAQLLRFTRAVKDGMDEAGREQLIEWLWEVIYADGTEHAREANLMRRIAGLIYVEDAVSGAARKRVRRRLGLED